MPIQSLRRHRNLLAALFFALAIGLCSTLGAAEDRVDFARDVRPILSRYCFKCHGPDDEKRQASLRLDVREAALERADSGEFAIVPGKPAASELLKRIVTENEDIVMPPPDTKQSLSAAQKETLKKWIAQGAEYQPHWAFIAPQAQPLPMVKDTAWGANEVDTFILARLEREGLAPSPDADRATLVRRAYLDLTGLPPTPAAAQAFIHDARPDAYERLVDRLLASPAYGERWARKWLDLARYADTNGYEKDRVRSIWPYRDWVIRAINADMPFDQFTVEQLAGDMLPSATAAQKIATGFHRNTMINEEGGIDPLEFRYYAVVDRINTTATTWLGLTLGCAQCHTHKYDPITHREYFAMMAYLNNADEPEMSVVQPELRQRRETLLAQIAELEAALPTKFSTAVELQWANAKPTSVISLGKATTTIADDGAVLLSGENPPTDTLTLQLASDSEVISALRLHALVDAKLPSTGPGRTPHGNFVVSGITISYTPPGENAQPQAVKVASATADFEQQNFPAAQTLDGNPKTGWAISGSGKWNVDRAATFLFAEPVRAPKGSTWTVTLAQDFGTQHTLGKFRLSLGSPLAEAERYTTPEERFEQAFAAWQEAASKKAVAWTVLKPTSAKSETPLLTILDDGSVLSSGDQTKRDIYTLDFASVPAFTAIRLETIPDERLPKRGPGRIYYEGPAGDFFLSQISASHNGQPLAFSKAAHSFASGGNTAEKAIDSDPQSGWSINGGQGKPHTAVFTASSDGGALQVQMLFERYYAAGLGRFRLSVSNDAQALDAVSLPAEVNDILVIEASQRSSAQQSLLRRYFASIAPELAAARAQVDALRKQLPEYPTTLVMTQRPETHPRATFRMHRGEFLQPKEQVAAAPLTCLNLPIEGEPGSRLAFSRWLVNDQHPLTARVVVNRHWAAFFGRGLVKTTEDFGLQGDLPSHPQLLDWLAIEFMRQGWSVKDLHRLLVTSRTYQQQATVTPALAERDPQNILFARAPRVRLEAEALRDYALAVSGLLSLKQGGPSVFPPQPASITTEGAYGALAWNISPGEDRYRRGLYTFAKRTAPYAMLTTFDAPTGEACLARREVSNTPLQALVMLNDEVIVEAARAIGREIASAPGDDATKAQQLFAKVLVRAPTSLENDRLLTFIQVQRVRLTKKELDAQAIAGPGTEDAKERAVWTVLARALLNLDEAVTKE